MIETRRLQIVSGEGVIESRRVAAKGGKQGVRVPHELSALQDGLGPQGHLPLFFRPKRAGYSATRPQRQTHNGRRPQKEENAGMSFLLQGHGDRETREFKERYARTTRHEMEKRRREADVLKPH